MKRIDYIPAKDGDFDAFQDNLVARVTANAVAWNITPVMLAALTPLQAAWVAAWLIAKVKVNRSPAVTATKNQARDVYEHALRNFIQGSIYHNPVMNNGDIELCGLRPYDRTRTTTPAPGTLPIVNLQHMTGNRLAIRFFRLDDETGAIHRGKPNGVRFIEFAYSLDMEPASPAACPQRATQSRGPIIVEIPLNMRGRKIWFYARWVGNNNDPGPWTDLDFFVL